MRFLISCLILMFVLPACSSAPKPKTSVASKCPAVPLHPFTGFDLHKADAWQAAYRAVLAHQARDYPEAATQWRKAHVIEPHPALYWNAALELALLGNYEQAKGMLTQVDSAELPEKLRDDHVVLEHFVGIESASDADGKTAKTNEDSKE